MTEKTVRGEIPSIRVDKQFFKDIGDILEFEVKERKNITKEKINKEINKRSREIAKNTYYKNEEERESATKEMREHVARIMSPHMSVKYEINSNFEDLSFSSIEEVIETKFFPDHIRGFSFRVNHYNNDFVDISLSAKMYWSGIIGEYNLSSSNEGRLLKIKKDLKDLFKNNETGYGRFLYPYGYNLDLPIQILTLVLSILVTYLYHSLINDIMPIYLKDNLILLFVIFLVSKFTFSDIIKYLYPYFDIQMSSNKPFRMQLRIIFGFIFSGITMLALERLISYFLMVVK